MNESENFARRSKLAAVTRMECVDQAVMSGCFGGNLWAACAALRSKEVVAADVIYRNLYGWLRTGWIPNGSPFSECNERARHTMRAAAATGQSCGVIVSRKNGIFSPFCLFFCVLQRILTEVIVDICFVVIAGAGISPSRKNSKSSAMNASGGCDGHEVMRLYVCCDVWHHSEARKPA